MPNSEEEERIQQALYAAIDYTGKTEDATEAVAKTAREFGFNAQESTTLATHYNKAKMFAMSSQLDESARPAECDIADTDKVLEKVQPEHQKLTKASSDKEAVKLPSLSMTPDIPSVRKTASDKAEQLRTSRVSAQEIHDTHLMDRKIINICEKLPKLATDLKKSLDDNEYKNKYLMQKSLYKAADEITRYSGDRQRKVAQRILNAFGEDLGQHALDTMSSITGKDLPKVQKTASHSILPNDRIYQYISEARQYGAKARKNQSLKTELTKDAAGGVPADVAESITGKTLGNQPGADIIQKALGHRDREQTYHEKMPADIFQKLKGLESREAFMKAVLTNPTLQEFNLDALQDAFNYSIETNPELTDSPRSLANLMLTNIQQGNIDTIDQLSAKKQMGKADVEKEKNILEKEEIKRKSEKERQDEEKSEKREQQMDKKNIYPQREKPYSKYLFELLGQKASDIEQERKEAEKARQEQQAEKDKKEEEITRETEKESAKTRKDIKGKMPLYSSPAGRKGMEATYRFGAADIPFYQEGSGKTTYLAPEEITTLFHMSNEGNLPEGYERPLESLRDQLLQISEKTGYKPMSKEEFKKTLGEVSPWGDTEVREDEMGTRPPSEAAVPARGLVAENIQDIHEVLNQ